MTAAQRKALTAHRRRRRDRGMVRVEVEASETDAPLLREAAAALRGEPGRAREVRALLRAALRPTAPGLLELLACDLPDDAMDEALARPREWPRESSL
jgi:hypothetical protein